MNCLLPLGYRCCSWQQGAVVGSPIVGDTHEDISPTGICCGCVGTHALTSSFFFTSFFEVSTCRPTVGWWGKATPKTCFTPCASTCNTKTWSPCPCFFVSSVRRAEYEELKAAKEKAEEDTIFSFKRKKGCQAERKQVGVSRVAYLCYSSLSPQLMARHLQQSAAVAKG